MHVVQTENNPRSFSRLREMSEFLEGILAVVPMGAFWFSTFRRGQSGLRSRTRASTGPETATASSRCPKTNSDRFSPKADVISRQGLRRSNPGRPRYECNRAIPPPLDCQVRQHNALDPLYRAATHGCRDPCRWPHHLCWPDPVRYPSIAWSHSSPGRGQFRVSLLRSVWPGPGAQRLPVRLLRLLRRPLEHD